MTDGWRPKKAKFIGLDIETSGTNPDIHSLIQIGVAALPLKGGAVFSSDVGGPATEWLVIDPEALKVNGFDKLRMCLAPPAKTVDMKLEMFLKELNPEGYCVCVGFNVGEFDKQFVRKAFPESYKRLGYRSVDLNSVIFTLAEARLGAFDEIKTKAKGYAEGTLRDMGFPTQKHDALWDAREALLCWQYLRGMLPKRVPHLKRWGIPYKQLS